MNRLLGLLFLLFLVFVAAFVYYADRPETSDYAAVLDLCLVAASATCFWAAAAAASPGADRIWYRISVGLFVWCLAIILRLLERWLHQPDYGTLSDGFWVAGYLPMLSGAYLWYRSEESSRRQRMILACVIVLACAAILIFFQRSLILDPSRPFVLKTLDVSYMVIDLLLAGFLAVPSLKPHSWGCRALMAAVMVVLASDIVLSHYGEDRGSWVYVYLDLPYCTAYFLMVIAGMKQREIIASQK